MGLFIGDSEPSKIFVGDTPISKVFLGDTQVRPSGPVIPTNGLLAYYPFEVDGNDASGNGNNAIVTGCSFGTIGGMNGVRLQETYSDFPTNYIESSLVYSALPVTIICWGYSTATTGWLNIMSNAEINDDTNNLRLRFGNVNMACTSYGVDVSPGYSFTANQWIMYGITINGTDGKVYVNGQPIYSFTSGTNNNSTGAWSRGHGKGWSSYRHPWVGWIRHSAIYNIALTDAEMLAYYQATA